MSPASCPCFSPAKERDWGTRLTRVIREHALEPLFRFVEFAALKRQLAEEHDGLALRQRFVSSDRNCTIERLSSEIRLANLGVRPPEQPEQFSKRVRRN